eukprot:163471_1
MAVILYLVLYLWWRCVQPQSVGIDFDIDIESLSEYDEDDERVLSNTYTHFTSQDWINQSLFEPILPNNGHLRMIFIPQRHAFEYTITIKHWPWHNRNNSIEFCLHLSIPHANGLQFNCKMRTSLEMDHDTIDVCHHFHSEELLHVAHIYYNTETNHTLQSLTSNSTGWRDSQEVYLSETDHTTSDQNMWLVGVSLAIATVLCSFALLITYLIKMGFFQDTPRPKQCTKRKRSTIVIGMGKHRSSTTTSSTVSTPPSPKKNLRINVTHHSPTPQNPCKVQSLSIMRHLKKKSRSSCSMDVSRTGTCDTMRILDYLPEGNEEEDVEECDRDQDDDDEMDTLTRHICDELEHSLMPSIVTPTVHSRNDTDMDSMIQYIITATNEHSTGAA